MSDFATLQLIRMKALAAKLGVHRSTIYFWQKTAGFPAPLEMGARTVAWDLAAVETWLSARQERKAS